MRRADAAVAVSRLFTEIVRSISRREPYASAPTREALELMAIMTFVVVKTREAQPPNASEIARHVGIPRSTTLRRLKTLIETGRIKQDNNLYVANLEFFDEIVTPHQIQDWYVLALDAAHTLSELRAGLAPVGRDEPRGI